MKKLILLLLAAAVATTAAAQAQRDTLTFNNDYYFSKRKIIRNTEPIVSAVETLADGKPVSLHISGELSDIASSVNKASSILNRQNEARANWISGVSHDIRTPLSMNYGVCGPHCGK